MESKVANNVIPIRIFIFLSLKSSFSTASMASSAKAAILVAPVIGSLPSGPPDTAIYASPIVSALKH